VLPVYIHNITLTSVKLGLLVHGDPIHSVFRHFILEALFLHTVLTRLDWHLYRLVHIDCPALVHIVSRGVTLNVVFGG